MSGFSANNPGGSSLKGKLLALEVSYTLSLNTLIKTGLLYINIRNISVELLMRLTDTKNKYKLFALKSRH